MRIAVIIPTFNRSQFLLRTLHSVFAQTRSADEIIVVDDGSTEDIAATMGELRSKVTYIRQENAGPSAARNNGTRHTTADYILFLDSDDLLEPTALDRLEQTFTANPNAAAVYAQATFIAEDDSPLPEERRPRLLNDEANGDLWRHLLWGNCIRTTGIVLIRRSHLGNVGDWDKQFRINEDWDMWLRLTETGATFVRLAEPLLRYRIHTSNVTGDKSLARRTGLLLYEKHLARHRNDPERFPLVLCAYAACYIAYCENTGTTETTPMPEPWATEWRKYQEATGIQDPLAAATTDGLDPRLNQRHARLRRLIEKSGAAALYRMTPLRLRLWMRSVFGVDVNA